MYHQVGTLPGINKMAIFIPCIVQEGVQQVLVVLFGLIRVRIGQQLLQVGFESFHILPVDLLFQVGFVECFTWGIDVHVVSGDLMS
ncbi:MAG: hypothetical protein R6U04_03420 [Bacteroidales bacterium]